MNYESAFMETGRLVNTGIKIRFSTSLGVTSRNRMPKKMNSRVKFCDNVATSNSVIDERSVVYSIVEKAVAQRYFRLRPKDLLVVS